MSKFQLKKIALTLSLSAALSAQAAGLGTMISSSKLGEPLNAEIELLAVTPSELNSIQATLASEQVYQEQMLEKPASYPFIKIEVGNNTKGQPVLRLSSSQPITEAFLDMLIQVDWPTGRLVKEYTLLLDPPGFNSNYVSESAGLPVAGQAETPVPTSKPAAAPETSQDVVAPSKKPAPSKSVTAKPAAPKPTADEQAANVPDTLTTERGDTLYAIARQMKPDNVSTEQMLAALYKTNQQAFDGKNMNRLKVGKIIRLPDEATLESVSQPQAKSLIAEHATNWHAYKNSLAKVVKEAEPGQAGGNAQQSAGKIGSAGDKAAPQAKAGKDVLKLSAGDERSTTQADKSAAKAAAAAAAQEEATAKANAIKEEQSRAAALEKQVADMKKLMEMKNNAMAQAEKNAAQTATEQKTEAPKVEPKTEQVPVTPEKPAEQAKVPPTPVAPEKSAPAKPEVPAVAPAIEAPQKPSFMHVLLERLRNISPVLPWALIALPVLLCVWALIRIRRKKQIDNFEDVIVTSPATEMQNNTVFGDTQAATSGDTSFLTDFSQSGVGGMIDSHDVDPIAEAEVYMAYGRDAQAEEILKDAIQKDPARQELKLKLLEIYQATANKGAFEALASDIYAKVGPADTAWSKVTAMGQKLDPENSLYQTAQPVLASAALAEAPVTAATTSGSITELPVIEAPNQEEGYHFNFETPALEFEGAEEAVAAAMPAAVEENARPANNATEEVNLASIAETAPIKSDVSELKIEEPAELSVPSLADDAALEFPQVPVSPVKKAEDLHFEVEPGVAAQDDMSFGVEVDSELTPKALDLPSLNLDEGVLHADAAGKSVPAATSGEQTLSNEDAVFESLPELSLELGGPNDATAVTDAGLDIEEINLEAPDESLNEPPAIAASADNLAFPEISLDVADSTAVNEEALAGEPEEVNTKLDLIQAYIDMEDVIGAKELIEEVMTEGGERQKQRASELLAKLA